MDTPKTIIIGNNLDYTVLCSFYFGSSIVLFGVDHSGNADFKYICCFAEPLGTGFDFIRPVASGCYEDTLMLFRERAYAESFRLEDMLEDKIAEDEAL